MIAQHKPVSLKNYTLKLLHFTLLLHFIKKTLSLPLLKHNTRKLFFKLSALKNVAKECFTFQAVKAHLCVLHRSCCIRYSRVSIYWRLLEIPRESPRVSSAVPGKNEGSLGDFPTFLSSFLICDIHSTIPICWIKQVDLAELNQVQVLWLLLCYCGEREACPHPLVGLQDLQ